MVKFKKELVMKFDTDSNYEEALRAFDLLETVKDRINLYESEYSQYDGELREFFNGVYFEKERYNSLEGEEKNNISRLLSLRDKTHVKIQLLKELLK